MFWYYLLFHFLHISIGIEFNIEEMIHKDEHILRNIDRDVYFSDVMPERSYKFHRNQTELPMDVHKTEDNMIQGNIDAYFEEYAEHLRIKGLKQLNNLGKWIEGNLHLLHNATYDIVKAIAEEFQIKFRENLNRISISDDWEDRDSLIPVLMQTSNKIIFNAKNKLISKVGDKYTGKTADLYKILTRIRKQHSNANKMELEFLCKKANICLNYVGFSDYMVDTLTEVLKCDNREIKELVTELKNQLKSKSNVFKMMLSDDTIKFIDNEVNRLTNELDDLRLLLTVIRSVLKNRLRPINARSPEVVIRTEAMRNLLQIIDRAYGYEEDNEVEKIFDLLIKQLSQYRVSFKTGLKNTLDMFINQMVTVFKENISRPNKEKVNNLTNIILFGD